MTDPSTSTPIPENPHKNENVVLFIILICSILFMPVIYLCYKLYLVWKAKKEKIKRILKQNERLKALHSKAISIKLLTGQKIGSSLSGSFNSASAMPSRVPMAPPAALPGQVESLRDPTNPAVQELDVGKVSEAQRVESGLMDVGPLPVDIADLEEENEEKRRKILKSDALP